MSIVVSSLVYLAFLAFCAKRLMTYLHVLQQEDYLNARLLGWIKENKGFDKRLTPVLFVLGAIAFADVASPILLNILILGCFVAAAYFEADPRNRAKKKLVLTSRAKRIYFPAIGLMAIIGLLCFGAGNPALWIIPVQLTALAIPLVNLALQPYEKKIQKHYWNEAKSKIDNFQPTVIGITGSFGKTSVKHILGHILKSQAPTLITPGSVNTPMGITRIIREQLDESHKYFVVEMGAYGPGSIATLCKLTPPDYGILTAIGHAHYERFKTLETVCEAKFELAQAVIAKNGKMIVHESTMRFDYAQTMRDKHPANFLTCGENGDWVIDSVTQTQEGLTLRLSHDGKTHDFDIPLFGLHHGHNAALAIIMALELKVDVTTIRQALKSVPQIQHRLEVKKQPDGTRIIDDAFNSNPLGFKAALELLGTLKGDGRGILITPGMVELGKAHDEEHEKIGLYAGEVCDVAIVVASQRIPSFIKAFKNKGSGKTLLEVATFDEAAQWLNDNRKTGDVVLLENDLPDIYERIPQM